MQLNDEFFEDLEKLGNDLLKIAVGKQATRMNMLEQLRRLTSAMCSKYGERQQVILNSADVAKGLLEHYGKLYKRQIPLIKSGIGGLDDILGGFEPAQMYLIASRPAQGKSSLMISLKKSLIDRDLVSFFVSAEMSWLAVGKRMVAQYVDFPVAKQRPGISNFNWETLCDGAEQLGQRKFFINDATNISTDDIDQCLIMLTAEGNKPDIVFIDYAQLVEPMLVDRKAPAHEQLRKVSQQLLAICKRHNVPLVAAVQETREVDGRKGDARLSDLGGSSQFEKDAHVVMHIRNERPEDGDERVIHSTPDGKPMLYKAKLRVSKNRTGATGDVELLFQAPLMWFYGSLDEVEKNKPKYDEDEGEVWN